MINKYALGTIVGSALIGFFRSKIGSSVRLGLRKQKKVDCRIYFISRFPFPENLSDYIESVLERYRINKPNFKVSIYDEWQEDVNDYRVEIIFQYISNVPTDTNYDIWSIVENESWRLHDLLLDQAFSPLNIQLDDSNVDGRLSQKDIVYNVDTGKPYQAPLKANAIKLRRR